MSLTEIIVLEGLAYTVFFGGLARLRREGLSGQFALEATLITAAAAGLTAGLNFPVHPVLFLVILYLITMRARLLVDIGNLLAQRGQFAPAERLYNLAVRLWPDQNNRLIVRVNQGVVCLQRGALDQAIAIFQEILQRAGQGHLGARYEAATHYNLGLAYRRKHLDAQATMEFNAVLEAWPFSEYARHAAAALEQKRHKNVPG